MRRIVLALSVALSVPVSGCAAFDVLTPKGAYTEISKGVWLAKSSTFLGVRFASQEVLFCYADDKEKPICHRAGGDVDAASIKKTAESTEKQQK
jgi:hypothetical protein